MVQSAYSRVRRVPRRTTACMPVLTMLLAFACLASSPPPAWSGLETSSDLRGELERTDRALERAAEYLRSNPCKRGTPMLERAEETQARARAVAGDARRSRLAVQLTLRARVLVNEAIRACPPDGRAVDRVRDLVARTEALAARIEGELRERPDEEGARYAEAARSQLQRAREAYRRQDFRQAVRWLAVARNLYQRAQQEVRGPLLGARHIEAALERCELLLEEVRLALAGETRGAAHASYEQAMRFREQARTLLSEGRLRLALEAIARARSRALEAHWSVGRTVERSEVERAIEIVAQSLDELAPGDGSSRDDEAAGYLDAARSRLEDARTALERGDAARAAELVRVADSLLSRAADLEGAR